MSLPFGKFAPRSRKSFVTIGSAAFATAVLRAPARAAQFEFRGGSDLPASHPVSTRLQQMCATIGTESGGRIHGQYFPNGALGATSALLSQVRIGAVQFGSMAPALIAGLVPPADITNLGFAFLDEPEALRALDGPLGDYIRKEIAAKGMYALRAIWNGGMKQITSSSRPIRTAADLSGQKIRVAESKIIVDFYKTLGASPVPMSFTQLYTALQTKIVDGADAPLATIESARLSEVQKYLSLTNHGWSGNWLIVNDGFWKSLPPDLQEIVERNNAKYSQIERRDTIASNGPNIEKLERLGLQSNTVAPENFRAHLKPYFDQWAGAFGATEWRLLQSSIRGKLN